jgi:hypothetical protein
MLGRTRIAFCSADVSVYTTRLSIIINEMIIYGEATEICLMDGRNDGTGEAVHTVLIVVFFSSPPALL